MIHISLITVFPELHEKFLTTSLVNRAQKNGLVSYSLFKFSDFCEPGERIDEPTCGPGDGMLIKPEVIEKAITHVEKERGHGFRIFFSPQGVVLTQKLLRTLSSDCTRAFDNQQPQSEQSSKHRHLILICTRYEGIDERVQNHYADLVISIGDYVVMGGDLPAQIFLEGLLRLFPGVIGKWGSVVDDSFSGPLLDHPVYGLPVTWKNNDVPALVLSGNHAAIKKWYEQQALHKTIHHRFDWFRSAFPNDEQIKQARNSIPRHYVALMHTDVVVKGGMLGTTSITSLDIHDLARSCATYGVENVFMVTPLEDQKIILETFLKFWHSHEGKTYNFSRHEAVQRVLYAATFADLLQMIEEKEGKKPLIITTSAKHHAHEKTIDYTQQSKVWFHDRPVLLLFGTGQGLAEHIVQQSDYLLLPVHGMTSYNHLSVRAAVAIILDRWLGLQPRLE